MLHTDIVQQLFWTLNFGKVKFKVHEFEILNEKLDKVEPTIFFLSTGRTATKWFAHLLNKARHTVAFHEAMPLMRLEAKYAYELWNNSNIEEHLKEEILTRLFLATRGEYLIYAAKTKKTFVETNHYLTFFAPVINNLLSDKVKFVHIYRHPGDFIRSGLIRGWYEKDNPNNITLLECDCPQWQNMDRIERLAWLWKQTNSFVEDFRKKIAPGKIFKLNFYDIKDYKKIRELIDFLGLDIKEKTIRKLIQKPKNVKSSESFPPYKQWSEEDKLKVKNIAGDLAAMYGFKL